MPANPWYQYDFITNVSANLGYGDDSKSDVIKAYLAKSGAGADFTAEDFRKIRTALSDDGGFYMMALIEHKMNTLFTQFVIDTTANLAAAVQLLDDIKTNTTPV